MRIGRAKNHGEVAVAVVGDGGCALEQVCQFLQADLAMASESGERKEKILAKRSKGRLLHIDMPKMTLQSMGLILICYLIPQFRKRIKK